MNICKTYYTITIMFAACTIAICVGIAWDTTGHAAGAVGFMTGILTLVFAMLSMWASYNE